MDSQSYATRFNRRGLRLQQRQVAIQDALIAKGVAIDDPTALQRVKLELMDKQVQLQAADRQLASALLRLTCCTSDLRSALVEGLEIQPAAIDCDRLRLFALEHRWDHLAVVQLCQCVDDDTARDVASLLTPLAGAGLDLPSLNFLSKLSVAIHGDDLLPQIRKELRLAIATLRSRIEQEVCDKCGALTTAYQRVTIAESVAERGNSVSQPSSD